MQTSSQAQELFRKERAAIHKLLNNNPNYFGTVSGVDFPAVQPIKFNTAYEELTCVGLWPEKNLLEATLVVKQPFGFLGGLCTQGSQEYVRFFIDWDNDGDFNDFNEDQGFTSVNVHDIAQVKKHPLCYAVPHTLRPFLADCKQPYIVKLRAILSWEIIPTGPNFVPIWGNVLECWVQVDPVEGRILGIVANPPTAIAQTAPSDTLSATRLPELGRASGTNTDIEVERLRFLELIKQNPNYFGNLPDSTLKAIHPTQQDTRYEELKCLGLYPERDFLEAVLEVKRPDGFLGPLCTPGSYEYVRFFVDWNDDGDFVDLGEDAGVAAVHVHDIPQVKEHHLCYALGKRFRIRRSTCQQPYLVKVRAILSWQQVPTGPNFIPVWGNILERWVQIRPTIEPPQVLVGVIDTPVANACVVPVAVITCVSSSGPVIGIQITGSAGGTPFSHYTLRYSYGGNPPINDAVVYPDCSRPPTSTSSTVPVINNTLGYLDVSLLPPGITEFTIYLDVFDTGSGVLSPTRTFKLRTKAVEVSAAATVNALTAEDPFHLGSFTKLIKATNNASPTVPEVSIGGSFSVTGSAYVVGCDRIMSQYELVSFPAPPVSPVPNIPNAVGGTPLMPPVVYADTLNHPWQSRSGCSFASPITPNTIVNGNLVASWSGISCTLPFPPFTPYTIPKVRPVPFWNSGALNGRYVLLLDVKDRLESGGSFPGTFAAKDQVVVWIDNRDIAAKITSIGGLLACQDLRLSQFVGKTAEIRGVAWDPPIDFSAPQQQPNDNFGSYGLAFQKNGGGDHPIAVATPTLRVPNVWAASLAPGVDGTLANWDIVAALDGGVAALPPGSPQLRRGERCAYVIKLGVADTTHVGDSGSNHTSSASYALTIINDIV